LRARAARVRIGAFVPAQQLPAPALFCASIPMAMLQMQTAMSAGSTVSSQSGATNSLTMTISHPATCAALAEAADHPHGLHLQPTSCRRSFLLILSVIASIQMALQVTEMVIFVGRMQTTLSGAVVMTMPISPQPRCVALAKAALCRRHRTSLLLYLRCLRANSAGAGLSPTMVLVARTAVLVAQTGRAARWAAVAGAGGGAEELRAVPGIGERASPRKR